jgi:hypothetical protein
MARTVAARADAIQEGSRAEQTYREAGRSMDRHRSGAPARDRLRHGRQTSSVRLRRMTPPPSRPVWAHSVFWFTVAFIPIHVYWAMGGMSWLPAAARLPANRPAVQVANWGVAVLLATGAAIVLALARPAGRRVPAAFLLPPIWTGSVVCVSHAIFGMITKGLYLSGVHGAVDFPAVPGAGAAAAYHTSAVLDLAVFEPWFLIEGVLLLLAGRQFLRTPASRHLWTMSVIIGVALVDVFGTLLAVSKLHFAVY